MPWRENEHEVNLDGTKMFWVLGWCSRVLNWSDIVGLFCSGCPMCDAQSPWRNEGRLFEPFMLVDSLDTHIGHTLFPDGGMGSHALRSRSFCACCPCLDIAFTKTTVLFPDRTLPALSRYMNERNQNLVCTGRNCSGCTLSSRL